jgi:hypothetical protein
VPPAFFFHSPTTPGNEGGGVFWDTSGGEGDCGTPPPQELKRSYSSSRGTPLLPTVDEEVDHFPPAPDEAEAVDADEGQPQDEESQEQQQQQQQQKEAQDSEKPIEEIADNDSFIAEDNGEDEEDEEDEGPYGGVAGGGSLDSSVGGGSSVGSDEGGGDHHSFNNNVASPSSADDPLELTQQAIVPPAPPSSDLLLLLAEGEGGSLSSNGSSGGGGGVGVGGGGGRPSTPDNPNDDLSSLSPHHLLREPSLVDHRPPRWNYGDDGDGAINDGFDVDVELTLEGSTPEAFQSFGFSGQQLGWALARSWQAKAWFKPDIQGDGEEDQGLDILEGVRAAALDRVEVSVYGVLLLLTFCSVVDGENEGSLSF